MILFATSICDTSTEHHVASDIVCACSLHSIVDDSSPVGSVHGTGTIVGTGTQINFRTCIA